ncbi:hypothetical protein [Pseudomonas nunensis]|uniref:hypothetical protein n=1 Tax=Pseudomonas nunensis TaxID=2961896 RepID=UPI0025B05469|nr:hypothetical protein [Pseudomonas nunensis]MDN3219533.1 hypothetical protein [Pseudomonas nunensis]
MTTDMNLNAAQQIAEDSRKALRLKQLSDGSLADSPAPNIVGVAEGALCPVGILKSTAAQSGTTTAARQPDLPITITVHNWEFPNARDEVVIEGYAFQVGVDNPDRPDQWSWVEWLRQPAPALPRPSQWNVTLPPGLLTDLPASGTVSPTQWKVQSSGSLDGNPQYSLITTIFVDTYAPFHNKGSVRPLQPTRLDFPLAPGAVIDSAYLATIATTGMVFTLPVTDTDWDFKPTDKAFIYLSSSLRPSRQLTPTLVVNPVPTDGRVSIPAADVARLANGTVWLIMAYEDAAGNRSLDMLAQSRTVRFVPLPVLGPPIIDAASTAGDNLIDLADVRFYLPGGLPIRVVRPLNTEDTDRASVHFEGFDSIPLTPASQAFGTNSELTFTIAWADLKVIYFSLTGGDPDAREVNAPVLWTWTRGTDAKDSPKATPDLDFSYPGEENPDEPGLINRNLAQVEVRGAVSAPNILNPDDLVRDPDVTFPLPTPPNDLGNDVVCTWFYDGEAMEEFSPAGRTRFDGKLPVLKVIEHGPGPKLTYWGFSYIGGVNPQRSRDQTVTVTTVRKLVPPPVVQRLFEGDTINCPTLGYIRNVIPAVPAADFRVAADPVLAGLQSITMHWTGSTDAAGLNPISGTDQDIPVTVTGTEATSGFGGAVGNYLTKIKPIQTRPDPAPAPPPPATYGVLWYTAVWTDGSRTDSTRAVYRIGIVNGNREYCDEVRPVPGP